MKEFYIRLFIAISIIINTINCGNSDGYEGKYIITHIVETSSLINGNLTYVGPLDWYMNENHKIRKNLTFSINMDSDKELSFSIK